MKYERKYAEIAAALYDALASDPFYYTLEASAPADKARDAMLDYLDYSLTEAENHGMLSLVYEDGPGAAAWRNPLDAALAASIAADKKAFIAKTMGAACLDTYTSIANFMQFATRPHVSVEAWYLSIIGVSPTAQGRGIGRKMVAEGLQHTDAAGLPTYLETFTPRNRRFYQRLGYEEAAVIHEPRTGASYSVMVRRPRRG